MKIYSGRYTVKTDDAFVVFLIGMRINKFSRVRKWSSVGRAMVPMLQTLYAHPEKGFLGGEQFLFWPGTILIQYWRSFEDLEDFARNPSAPHLSAWKRFNQQIGDNGSVGIFHETYMVAAGAYECVYGNMPRFGLGAVFEHLPATGSMSTARQRRERVSA